MKKIITAGILAAILLAPAFAIGQITDPFSGTEPTLESDITNYSSLMTRVQLIAKYMLGILLALAVIFLIVAAFYYLTSGGEEKSVTKAKNYLIYAIVAVAIGLLAQGIVIVISSIVR